MNRLGTDLDDVLLDTSNIILQNVEKRTGKKLDWNKIHSYSIAESYQLDEELVADCVRETLEGDELQPINGSVKIFNWLSQFYEMFIVSKRKRYLFSHTKQQLEEAGFENFQLFLNHPEDDWLYIYNDKHELVNELGINVFVEDNPDFVNDLYQFTDCKIFMVDRPWNRNVAENERITVVRNWNEIREYLI
jgi:5'(3')-deoxyribonucleotidase